MIHITAPQCRPSPKNESMRTLAYLPFAHHGCEKKKKRKEAMLDSHVDANLRSF